MKNLKQTKIKDTSVAYLAAGKARELKKSYLKGFAEYLTTTLPPELKYYQIKVIKTIRADGDKPGGLVAIEKNLVDETVIKTLFGDSVEEFKQRDSVRLLVNEVLPINFYRRLKRSTNIFEYICNLERKFSLQNAKTDEELVAAKGVIDYFTYLKQCLQSGVIPLVLTDEEKV
tara:strand:+ start:728 stop:1246 length:519 start_codon:yes stop_codon:yes gene_type:complete